MIKPDRLRDLLTQTIERFRNNPESLILQFDKGKIKATGGKSHSFEYHYNLEVITTDFPYHPDVLFVPVLEFIRTEQWELLQNPSNWESITFEIDRNNDSTYDIYISIPLTERVIVREEDGNYTAKHGNEPQMTEHLPIANFVLQVWHKDVKVYDSEQGGIVNNE